MTAFAASWTREEAQVDGTVAVVSIPIGRQEPCVIVAFEHVSLLQLKPYFARSSSSRYGTQAVDPLLEQDCVQGKELIDGRGRPRSMHATRVAPFSDNASAFRV